MPNHTLELSVAVDVETLFAFFRNPREAMVLSSPDLGLTLEEAPEKLEMGSQVKTRTKRWGISQVIVMEVVQLESPSLILSEIRQGPFPRWTHSLRFEPLDRGTKFRAEIEWKPPGGMLGMLLSESVMTAQLDKMADYQREQMLKLFGAVPPE